MPNDAVRVRFAPSPTGHLHIGGARTAIYNWAFARHHGGTFVLRIDDTDAERSTDENTAAILRAMRWLGLDWDEGPDAPGEHGPYYQTQRTALYAEGLGVLKANGHAYPCFCTAEQLESRRVTAREAGGFSGYDRTCRRLTPEQAAARIDAGEPHVWRVKVPEERGEIVFEDVIRGEVRFPGEAMDDFIVVRTDGSPTYNYATVVDDWKMGITDVIRGDDHLSNTPRQIVVYEALEAPVPAFAHMSLIFGPDGKRLSKRHGATSVEAYRDEGILPEALLNYLALMGWSLEDETVFPAETLIERFDLSRVSNSPGVWDPAKLEWMNGVYIRQLPSEELARRMVPSLVGSGLLSEADAASPERLAWLARLAPLVAERLKRLDELPAMVGYLIAPDEDFSIDEASREKVLGKEGAHAALEAALAVLGGIAEAAWGHDSIEEALRVVPERLGIKAKDAFQPVRVATSGTMVSLPLFESMELLGRDRTLARLAAALPLAGA